MARRILRPILLKLLLGLLLLVLLLTGLEVGLRAAGYAQGPAVWCDPEVGFRCQPHQTRWLHDPSGERAARLSTNALGFRGPLPRGGARPDVARVVTLGDSFTFGLGVGEEETYPAILRRLLAADPGSVEVLDVSFPGWDLSNEVAAYRAIVRELRADIVVLGFTQDDLKPADSGMRWTDGVLFRWFGRLAIADLAQRRVLPLFEGYRLRRTPREQALREAYGRNAKAIRRDPKSPEARPYWERARRLLEELRDAVRADGAELLVVVLPSVDQVRPLRSAASRGADPSRWIAERMGIQRELAEVCTDLNVPLVDALDAFTSSDEDPFSGIGRHPAPAGYHAIATCVTRALSARGLLDR